MTRRPDCHQYGRLRNPGPQPSCRQNRLGPVFALLIAFSTVTPARSADLFVNNLIGDDAFDGSAATTVDPQVGPTRSLRRAMARAQPGDTVILAATGRPYYEGIQLSGPRHSGLGGARFTIQGNGATLNGTRPVTRNAWRQVRPKVWKVTPWRKGFYQLFRGSERVGEHPLTASGSLSDIPEGRWSARGGSMYYHGRPLENPWEHSYRVAQRGVGLSLHRVQDVLIRDLTIVGFRVDGAHAVDQCRGVSLSNVTLQHNGRAGVAVSGTSEILLNKCRVIDNARDSVRISGLGAADLKECQITQPVRVIK